MNNKFIYAFVLARRESKKIFIEDIYKDNDNEETEEKAAK